ncbi:tetratricopeptide repeat protein [Parahaliea mediterranea]|uniref:Tetratricopeptide repeat protein n=1 Tax=Parahaliea mediterranea TaxID=651086 RepID=A0A939DGS4_9GAMM|nr:tetratricopeptide repeat protein [Parahaliea mediterranea]MBN7797202.1 tetratricopeptide repeat protein [Parahaliea mediterranea]
MTRLLLYFGLLCWTNATAALDQQLRLPPPQWVLDSNIEPLRSREAGLRPEEQAIASELRPLVQQGEYRRAITRLAQMDDSQFSAALLFVKAQLHLAANDPEGARVAYLATLEKMPDFQRAHRGLGMVYLRQDKPEAARHHIARAIALGANDAQLYGQLAYLNLETRSPASAIAGYRQALFLEPDNKQWQQGLLYALVKARHFEAARALVEEGLGRDGNDADLWLQYSNLALNTGDPVAALAALEVASRLGSLPPESALVAAQLHLREGSLTRGVALLEGSMGKLDAAHATPLVQTLDWLVQRQEWPAARRLADSLETRGKTLGARERSRVYAARSRIELANEQTDRARNSLERAIDIDPANGRALLALAELERDPRPHRAATLFERAAALEGFEEQASLGRARLAVAQADYSRALDHLLRVRELNPHHPGLGRNIASLERLVALGRH